MKMQIDRKQIRQEIFRQISTAEKVRFRNGLVEVFGKTLWSGEREWYSLGWEHDAEVQGLAGIGLCPVANSNA